MTQKDLDLQVANRLEKFNVILPTLIAGKMEDVEFANISSALEYAITSLRTEAEYDKV